MTASAAQVDFFTPTHCTGIFTEDVQEVRCSDDGRRLELIIQYVSEDGIIGCEPFTITVTGFNLQGFALALRLGENVSLRVQGPVRVRDSAAPFIETIEGEFT